MHDLTFYFSYIVPLRGSYTGDLHPVDQHELGSGRTSIKKKIKLIFLTICASHDHNPSMLYRMLLIFQILQHSRKKTRERGRKDAPGNWIPSDKHWFYKVTWQRVSCMPSTHYLPQDIKQIQFYFLFALTTPRTVSLECFRDCQILLLKSRQQSSVQYMFI